jgi:hypothetical protein
MQQQLRISGQVCEAGCKGTPPHWCRLRSLVWTVLQVILEQLDTHLVVFSPYLSLTKVLESDAQLADLGQNAWAALNDVYRWPAGMIGQPSAEPASHWLSSTRLSPSLMSAIRF